MFRGGYPRDRASNQTRVLSKLAFGGYPLMPGGRPRTPTRVLHLRGTHRADRHGRAEDEPEFAPLAHLPSPPGFLDDVAVYEWHRVGPDLVDKQLLTEVDLAAFTMYCVNCSRVAAAEKIIKALGMTITTPQGYVQARPEVSIGRQCGAEVRKFAQEFGMTPSSRTRVRTPEKPAAPKEDPWAEVAGG
jgi:P27 family predicted phage terminase small subunit